MLKTDSTQHWSHKCKKYLLKNNSWHSNIFNAIWNISSNDPAMKFSSILEKINVKSHKNILKMGAILFWTDLKRLFNWNMDSFKSDFFSRGHPGSKSVNKFFLSVLKMWLCCKYFLSNLIFALTCTARTLSGNHLNITQVLNHMIHFPATSHNNKLVTLMWLVQYVWFWYTTSFLGLIKLLWATQEVGAKGSM